MRDRLTWMLFLILPLAMVTTRPVQENNGPIGTVDAPSEPVAQDKDDEVISVSITSSVAVGRGKSKPIEILEADDDLIAHETASTSPTIANIQTSAPSNDTHEENDSLSLAGANIEFIKQLHSKKEARGTHHLEVHPFQFQIKHITNDSLSQPTDQAEVEKHITNDSLSQPTDQAEVEKHITNDSLSQPTDQAEVKQSADVADDIRENIENIPLGRSIALSPSSQNYIQGLSLSERGQGPRLTTVSFKVLHDTPKTISNYNEQSKPAPAFPDLQPLYSEPPKVYSQPAQVYSEPAKFYSEPAKVYSEPAKVYNEQAKVYSEPAKVYNEQAKVYSEPAKVYSEPAKVYSEPAKVYSEPAKFYSPHASLNLPQDASIPTPWQELTSSSVAVDTTTITTTVLMSTAPEEHRSEKNYEVDEKDSVLTDGQSHGVQDGQEKCKDDSCKVGYVVEGRQYRKYRVEERTSDGFIVGEYGVVRTEDGALRGVRYTADGDASPRLIYDALMKFLQL